MRARLALIPLALAAALLAGCATSTTPGVAPTTPAATDNGVSALSAQEILAKAVQAAEDARSFRMNGQISSEGETFKLDLLISGDNGSGSIELDGLTIEVLKVGADIYFKADQRFWETFGGDNAGAIYQLLKDKWVKAPAGESFSQFGAFFDSSEFLQTAGSLTKGETKTVNGVPTIAIVDSDPKDGGTIYVATTGEPYPVRIESTSGEGAIDFSDFGTDAQVTAPPASEVFDLSSLE